MRDARRPVQQRRQVARRSPAGEVLERLAPGEHQHDDERREVLADGERRDHGHDREDVESDVTAQHVAHHPDERPRDEDSDVGRRQPAPAGLLARGVEREDHDEDDHRGGDRRIPPQHRYEAHRPSIASRARRG